MFDSFFGLYFLRFPSNVEHQCLETSDCGFVKMTSNFTDEFSDNSQWLKMHSVKHMFGALKAKIRE